MKILTVAETREVDRLTTERYNVPSLELMESAGRSVAAFIKAQYSDFLPRRVAVLCGKGNNGGDGFVAARHLLKMGVSPSIFVFAPPEQLRGDAAANLKRLEGELKVSFAPDETTWRTLRPEIDAADIIIDALLGTGVKGPVQGLLAAIIEMVNQRERIGVIGVDVPSGLNADSGAADGPVVFCDCTVTFTAPKTGFFLRSAEQYVGNLVVQQIGSPPALIEEIGRERLRWTEPNEFGSFAKPRKPMGHKGDYGHALVVAGSVGKTGAAVLASWAALRAGAGLVTVATPEPALASVASHTPEVMTEPLAATLAGTVSEAALQGNLFTKLLGGKRALAIGPGLSTNAETQQFIRGVIGSYRAQPVILDADGLNAFAGRAAELRHEGQRLAVTPHPGEMARLLGSTVKAVQSDRLQVALKSAANWNAVVVLKGHQTIVASPDGSAYINSTGNPGMGSGGTGDALTGILAGLAAQQAEQLDTASFTRLCAFGAYLHGLAGDLAYSKYDEAPLLASDLIQKIPAAYRQFFSEGRRG